jgi:hypothetical protein
MHKDIKIDILVKDLGKGESSPKTDKPPSPRTAEDILEAVKPSSSRVTDDTPEAVKPLSPVSA